MSLHPASAARAHVLSNADGLHVELCTHGAVRRIDAAGITVNLFVGNEAEGGPANLWLRRHRPDGVEVQALLGPRSPLVPADATDAFCASGTACGLPVRVTLGLAPGGCTWVWTVDVHNPGPEACTLDLIAVQDVALAPYAAVRLNEHYVSHYLDFTPLAHPRQGTVLAVRQNQPVQGRHPWALFGSLRRAVSWATDALDVMGLDGRADRLPDALRRGLPGRRLQHEHAMAALQDETCILPPGGTARMGVFVHVLPHHAQASSAQDLVLLDALLDARLAALPTPAAEPAPACGADRGASAPADGAPEGAAAGGRSAAPAASLFATAAMLPAADLTDAECRALFGGEHRHVERGDAGELLSFFHGDAHHVVLRAKELRTMRPHGHILRAGRALVPDETALTSTCWMAGVFHSMLTQGHVSINRMLSTVHSGIGLLRSHGLRLFVQTGGGWQLLGVPSAFEIAPEGCRWIYRHAQGLFVVNARLLDEAQAMSLDVAVQLGGPLTLRASMHLALGGDDGSSSVPLRHQVEPDGVRVDVPAGSELARRVPGGALRVRPAPGTHFVQVGADERLYADCRSRGEPFLCIDGVAAPRFSLHLVGGLIDPALAPPPDAPLPRPRWSLPRSGRSQAPGPATNPAPAADPSAQTALTALTALDEIVPWFTHNALVHYLAPRGLEQYSGGGWGTRDVCQGPLEMLLALGRAAPVRDLLCRVFAAQAADGDWPQWFMFFDRERALRAGDSHGDIVFWPLLGLARYLLASGDAGVLDQPLPFFDEVAPAPLWQHVQRALAVIEARRIPGTALAAYGHGDWNDSLQPADPALRERLCSAWTVTLHHQTLATLSRALHGLGRAADAEPLAREAEAVRTDFQRWLVVDGVVTGYALFPPADAGASPGRPRCLLHPSDHTSGLHYSLLPMMHAVLADLFTPEQARRHQALVNRHLQGPDGARLFDAPMAYRGGPMHTFQRAESSAFFGREIGVMYMHAHIRWAETLAHLGDAEGLWQAIGRIHPVLLRQRVPTADLRQANCYYSSSDAAFADRRSASRDYAAVGEGRIRLDGGWRIYSSGPGIALALLVGYWLGLRVDGEHLIVDPVIAPALDGLVAELEVDGCATTLQVHVAGIGHGPQRLRLDGQDLPLHRMDHRYRDGGARIARSRWAATSGPRHLEVWLA